MQGIQTSGSKALPFAGAAALRRTTLLVRKGPNLEHEIREKDLWGLGRGQAI